MTTRVLAEFGVYGKPSTDEQEVLAMANEYRRRLCNLLWERHRAFIDLRNDMVPHLFAALVRAERLYWEISELEAEIKAHHSDVRDRNAVTHSQRERLLALRAERKESQSAISAGRKEWAAIDKRFRALLAEQADEAARKSIKTLAKRRALYESLKWSADLTAYAAAWIKYDLEQRELSEEFQGRGLHSSIRAEIVDASKPKIGKDGPGMRYEYARRPEPKPWEKITLQVPGGVTWGEVLDGTCRGLRADVRYINHKRGGDEAVVRVSQQIGTAEHPRRIEYTAKIDRHFPLNTRIQRWSIKCRGSKRTVLPIVTDMDFSKPTGAGSFSYSLRWDSQVDGSVWVASFAGDHVREELILPAWLVARRMGVKAAQAKADAECNAWLKRHGFDPSGQELQGCELLMDFAAKKGDCIASAFAEDRLAEVDFARREAKRAERCIEKIYETVTKRVCSLHAAAIHDETDLRTLKRYDTRDLLRADREGSARREVLFAVAPGKLRELLKGYGLASGEVKPKTPIDARKTDLFTSWIQSMAVKTGTKTQLPRRVSRSETKSADVA